MESYDPGHSDGPEAAITESTQIRFFSDACGGEPLNARQSEGNLEETAKVMSTSNQEDETREWVLRAPS